MGGGAIVALIFSWLCFDVLEKSEQKLSKKSHMVMSVNMFGNGNNSRAQMTCQSTSLAGGRYSHFWGAGKPRCRL